jgi:serine/threonine-protein kinase
MQNYVGQQIDRYRITERLGMGGMAVVYKAYDTRLERDVALKLIRTEAIPPEQYERLMKRFEREAKSQARFDHKHIVHIYDYGEVDGSPYLVMAFISGGTLKDRLHGHVDWRQAIRWLIPVAEALSYAHQHGIVHRDVKPANILFDEEDQPILTDFGIAKVLETDEATLTGTGLGVGTPEYMAPEQWQGKTSAATDQYALGVVLYELITGRKPYAADTPAAVAILQATEPLSPPSKLVTDIPESVEKVLYKALARNPEDRYENMGEFALALRGLMAEAETAEPILPQKDTQKQEPTYAPQASSSSEGITRDALDATPVEAMDVAPKNKRGLPKWALWAGIGVLGLIIIGVVIGLGGNPVTVEKESTESLAILAVETGTATILPGATKTTTPIKTASITPTPEPTLGIGSTMINEKDGAEMVYVPAGEFTMGSENMEAYSDEAPEHTVYLDAYWIYKYEVANTQYRQCIEDGACSGDLSQYPENNFPAVYINWNEATDYCAWAGGRLPTEAEWEKAARGEYGRTYPWGEASPNCSLVQYNDCSGEIVSVGSFPNGISPYGALDMAGNVWEWVADWYNANYYQNSPSQNPTGPASGMWRVLRGGSWGNNGDLLRASYRGASYPDGKLNYLGFRCLSSVAP